jgi:hypothetical protein
VDLVIAADAIRREAMKAEPSRFKPSQRLWIEPFFNFLGRGFGSILLAMPWPWRRPTDLWLNRKLAGHEPEHNPALPAVTEASIKLARRVKEQTGEWPAFFVLTSHPETMGPLEWLRFELLRQGLVVAAAVAEAERPGAWFRPAPQCFLAIDPYALDTVSASVGGFYAGWMNRVFIGMDRQPSTQSWIQRHWLLKGSTYGAIVWRLLRRLRVNPILMVFSGGLPHNSRMMYTAREFVQKLGLRRWPISKREAEKRLMEILMRPVDGHRPAEEGILPHVTRAAIHNWMKELGLEEGKLAPMLEALAEEFRLAVPYRARLLNVLLKRLVQKGKPLMLMAIAHRDTMPHVAIASPCAIIREGDRVTILSSDGAAAQSWSDAHAFAQRFVNNF